MDNVRKLFKSFKRMQARLWSQEELVALSWTTSSDPSGLIQMTHTVCYNNRACLLF